MKKLILIIALIMTAQVVFSQEIKKGNTAILVVEFQKTWTGKTFFNRLIKKEYESRNVYGNTKKLLDFARTKSIEIIQAPLYLDKTDKENYKKIPFQPKLFRQFTVNTFKAEFTEGIYNPSDLVVKGRCGFDATECSDLEKLLSENNIENVFIIGFTTDHCVAYTMKTLTEKGYNCTFVSDCTAAMNNKKQVKVEKELKNITSKELIEKFKKL